MKKEGPKGTAVEALPKEPGCSDVRDAMGVPAWQFFPAHHVRSDGRPTVVSDPAQLLTPLLQRILTALRTDYDPEFVIRWLGSAPYAPLAKPLSELRCVLITTACLHRKGDRPFDPYSDRWGDPSFRLIPHLAPPEALDLEADYVDEKYLRSDPEVALPMRALQHWVDQGLVGRAAGAHVSFCEGVVRPFPTLVESTREVVQILRADGVGAALLFPTCSLCVLNVCIIAREIEAAGIPTSTITLLPELSEIVGVPRPLAVKFPLGAPCGNPGNDDLHRRVVRGAIDRLAQGPDSSELVELDATWRS